MKNVIFLSSQFLSGEAIVITRLGGKNKKNWLRHWLYYLKKILPHQHLSLYSPTNKEMYLLDNEISSHKRTRVLNNHQYSFKPCSYIVA